MKQLLALVVGGAALAAAVPGCSTDPALFLGGPAGPIASLAISSSRADLRVGSTMTIGARGVDAVGNTTADAPTFASCDGSIVSVGTATPFGDFPTAAQVMGVGLGVSCVTVTAGSFTQNIVVATGPAGFIVTGPDTVGSGNAATFTVEPYDANGTVLSGTTDYQYTSSNTARLSVDAPTGVAAGKSTGSVTVRAVAPGGANATKSVVVVPGVFGGALSATSGTPGALITATRAAGGPPFDDDVVVRLGSTAAYVDMITTESVMFAVPATGSTAADILSLLNIGPNQIAQTTAFTASTAVADVYQPGNIDDACNIPGTIPVFENVKSPGGAVYIVHDGATHGTGSCLDAGSQGDDHWFTFTTGATGVTDIVAEWPLAGDYDIVVCDTAAKVAGNDNSCEYGYSSNANDETMTGLALAPNTQYWFAFEVWSGNAGINNVKIAVTTN